MASPCHPDILTSKVIRDTFAWLSSELCHPDILTSKWAQGHSQRRPDGPATRPGRTPDALQTPQTLRGHPPDGTVPQAPPPPLKGGPLKGALKGGPLKGGALKGCP